MQTSLKIGLAQFYLASQKIQVAQILGGLPNGSRSNESESSLKHIYAREHKPCCFIIIHASTDYLAEFELF